MDRQAAKELLHIKGWLDRVDEIDRDLTWQTLSQDLPAWNESLQELYGAAAKSIEEESG